MSNRRSGGSAAPRELTLDLDNGMTMKLVLVPAGTFVMGSPKSEGFRNDNEGPQHKVTISKPFYIGIHEVTQAQWRAIMGTEPWNGMALGKTGPDSAAGYIKWSDADLFCKILSKRTQRKVALPSEAQWEYACRAGSKTAYCFGDDASELSEYAWHQENAWIKDGWYPNTVGQKRPNSWGLYDMHGNVWEWCRDSYDKEYHKKSGNVDPENTTDVAFRVLRGGSSNFKARYCRSAVRVSGHCGSSRGNDGFRVVVSGE
jgi:formylglycine-generating enzyme required for sulfatase activity